METSFSMNGGDGPNSYTQNSKIQKEGNDQAKASLSNSIQEKLIIQNHSSAEKPQVFSIADLGCSVGPNTFACVNTIIEAVRLKFQTHGSESILPEFHVFFNDHVANDFNTLFRSLPLNREYMAAGVPGSFCGRLFPKASMNLMHSAFALHWLTKIPEELTDKESPAWNKGRITYVGSSNDVIEAYTAQFLRDMEDFFTARTVELVNNGLLAILILCRPEGTKPSESTIMQGFDRLGHAFTEMAKEGLLSEALVDSFNLPIFIPNASEVKKVVSSIQHLSIEKLEEIYYPTKIVTHEDARVSSLHIRAAMEGLIRQHFGNKIIDEIFKRFIRKLHEFSKTPRHLQDGILFLLVKCNAIP
ncbi:S-adenosylmethionine-dependent methyltransferase [Quillaja saponaria]|uniref:S-adenosylmethionine-dependent methyltransferase n=1 Tax=Quillaja saponaria TaxID=32244 RepID=A0AAD7KQH8_QUISA|nr:S-adenosylmethionine-dependent methyltransferase [Quillaja saponaria]